VSSNSSVAGSVAIDPVGTEIIRNYLLSVVREMTVVTIRAAYSTCFSEGIDFSCAIFDSQGRLFAQAAGLPVHFAALEDEVRLILDRAGELEEGDVLLHNDPFEGANHQSDVVVSVPIFWDGRLVGISVNRGHWMDIGAMFADGYGLARHVVQEGLIVPVCKLYRRGVLNREIYEFIVKNVRMPRLVWGDVQAQIASANVAVDRVRDLIHRYGVDHVQTAIEYSLDYTRRRFRDRMDVLPNGTFSAEDVMDDDGFGNGPFRIRVTINKTPDRLYVDFTGTDAQSAGAANCTLGATKAAVYTALKALVDPEIPLNSGIRELVEITAPSGTIVNPTYPAPVCCASADSTARICETVLSCWSDVLPELSVAGSYASGLNSTGWGRTADDAEFLWYLYGPGGCGARAARDGCTVEWHTMASCGNESFEVWESRYPVRFLTRELRIDSGGAGRTRGGLGDVRVVECLAETLVSCYLDRFQSAPWSIAGGQQGTPNGLAIERAGVERSFAECFGIPSPGKFSNLTLLAGDLFIMRSGGGGGYGPPAERDPRLVAHDVKNGYVSAAAARDLYRVAISPDGCVEEQATNELRRPANRSHKSLE
jgi:N-methylhydantoinase B